MGETNLVLHDTELTIKGTMGLLQRQYSQRMSG